MSNIFKIKHGPALLDKEGEVVVDDQEVEKLPDGALKPYELGYCDNNNRLYIGKNDGSSLPISINLFFYDENGDGNIIISTTSTNSNTNEN